MHEEPRDLSEIERLLETSRPLPAPTFRGELRRTLLAGRRPARPARLRLMVLGYGATGTVLLLVAAVGVAGAGPLAA